MSPPTPVCQEAVSGRSLENRYESFIYFLTTKAVIHPSTNRVHLDDNWYFQHCLIYLIFSVSLSPLSNKAAYAFLVGLQKELGVKFLPLNFRSVLSKYLNRYMEDVKVERVKFKVINVY